MSSDNGGIIGVVNDPTSTTASGVWQQEEQYEAKVNDTWPQRPLFTTKSLRFNSGSSDYLNRTQSGAGNRKTFTFSVWLKMALDDVATDIGIFSYYNDSNNFGKIGIQGDNNQFAMYSRTSGTFNTNVQISAMARDISAWSHLVVAVDTTQSTDSNRIKFYVNGTQQTSFVSSTYPSQNTDLEFNTTHSNYVSNWNGSSQHFDGYMTEVVFIDGQQLDATSFGSTNSDGVWIPSIYTGTFGTNGFNLQFEDASSLGTDSSANGNNFTVNNLTSIDQSTDYPEVNFCTLNPLDSGGGGSYSDGNLTYQSNTADLKACASSFALNNGNTGKWYWEIKMVSKTGSVYQVGTISSTSSYTAQPYSQYSSGGQVYVNGSQVATVSTYTTNDIIGVSFDASASEVKYFKNGSLVTTQTISNPNNILMFAGSHSDSSAGHSTYSFNFGSPSFAISSGNTDGNGYGNFEYAVPSGYYALNTANLAEFG